MGELRADGPSRVNGTLYAKAMASPTARQLSDFHVCPRFLLACALLSGCGESSSHTPDVAGGWRIGRSGSAAERYFSVRALATAPQRTEWRHRDHARAAFVARALTGELDAGVEHLRNRGLPSRPIAEHGHLAKALADHASLITARERRFGASAEDAAPLTSVRELQSPAIK